MRTLLLALALLAVTPLTVAAVGPDDEAPAPAAAAGAGLPAVDDGWKIELVKQAPEIAYPTAIVVAPDGTIYLGQDPMDMPGPPTEPADSVVAIKDGKVTVFAEKLGCVMGLEWVDGTLYVVHAPYLSALRDTDGDGKADVRADLITGLGPKQPAFNGINNHIAAGIRLGIDGFLYLAIGDKGIPHGVASDGTTVEFFGGGVIRIRPDGTGLEVVSTGERSPMTVALSATDEVFTYGNDDDSKKWPNSLTHHIVGGHYGYPYQFLTSPDRCLPIMGGRLGGAGAQGLCYNEDGLSPRFRGNLFFCDWGLQTVARYEIEKAGATYKIKARHVVASKGDLADFRPFSLAVAEDRASLYLVDWAYGGWLARGPQTGRLYRLTYEGAGAKDPAPPPEGDALADRIAALDHPALSVRLAAQRALAKQGMGAAPALLRRLGQRKARNGRLHALWALDAMNFADGQRVIRGALDDSDLELRLQAVRSVGIRRDRAARSALLRLLHESDPTMRREVAIALGRVGDRTAVSTLMAALADADPTVAWSIRTAIRNIGSWDEAALVAALLDPARQAEALKLTDEAWAVPVVNSLSVALAQTNEPEVRVQIVQNLAGLYRQYASWNGDWFGTNPLAGPFPQKTRDWNPFGQTKVVSGLAVALQDPSPEVRRTAIAGLLPAGKAAAPFFRARLRQEADQVNQAAMAQALGALGDTAAVPALAALVKGQAQPLAVRAAALDALGAFRDRSAMVARLAPVYDKRTPDALVARAILGAGRAGVLPPNDLAGFLAHRSPQVRVATLLSLGTYPTVPSEVKDALLASLDDTTTDVARAAVSAVAGLHLREAIPKLLTLAQTPALRTEATVALAAMPDPRALEVYLAAINGHDDQLQRAAESALLVIRDLIAGELESRARAGKLHGASGMAVERVLTRYRPVDAWRVIGPFPQTTSSLYLGDASIDFNAQATGALGKTIAWAEHKVDPATGRLVLEELKAVASEAGKSGFDAGSSPDLSAYAYTELKCDSDRLAMLLVGSSGSLVLELNGKVVYEYENAAGRAYEPDAELVQVELKAGTNRLLARTKQGAGQWAFSVQVPDPTASLFDTQKSAASFDMLRDYALENEGDAAKGAALFFGVPGLGCARCHSAAGYGTVRVGPDLSALAAKRDKAEIIRSVLEPSSRIAAGYQPVLLGLSNGQALAGLVHAEDGAYLEVIDADAKVTRVVKAEIRERNAFNVSYMPTGRLDSINPAQFADLIAFLQTLRPIPPSLAAKPGAGAGAAGPAAGPTTTTAASPGTNAPPAGAPAAKTAKAPARGRTAR